MAYTPGSHAGPFAIGMFSDETAVGGRREFAGLVAGDRVREIGADTGALLRDWDAALARLTELAAGDRGGPDWRPLGEDLRVLPRSAPGRSCSPAPTTGST